MGVIINFHEVKDQVWLENNLCFLKERYNPVDLPELINSYNGKKELKSICHITVDDGSKSFYDNIYPVLKKHKIPASIYVSPEIAINQGNFWFQEINGYEKQKLLKVFYEVTQINEKNINKISIGDVMKFLKIDQIWEIINRYKELYKPEDKGCMNMSVNELKEVEQSGLVTIGAHTLRHPILANEEMSVAKNEIASSITSLADMLGHEIKYFAYPNGIPDFDFGQREMDILKENGCESAFATDSGDLSLQTNLLRIPRYGLSNGDSISYTRLKIFSGSLWNTIVKIKPGNELVDRRALLKIFTE